MKKYLLLIKSQIILTILLYLLEVLITSVMLTLPGYLIDHFKCNSSQIFWMISVYFGLFIIYLVVCYFSNRVADYRRVKFEKAIKKDFFNNIMERRYTEYHEYNIREYLSMQSNDITEMCQNYLSPVLSIFRSFIMLIVFGFFLVYFVNFFIALTIILFSCMAVLVPKLTSKNLAKKNGILSRKIGKYTQDINLFFEAHDILNRKEIKRIEEIHEIRLNEVSDYNMNFRKLNSTAMVLNGGIVEFISVLSFSLTAILLFKHEITIGMATTTFIYSTKFMEPISELNINIGRIKSVSEIQNKLCKLLALSTTKKRKIGDELKIIESKNIGKKLSGRYITYEDMRFVYPNKYLICGDNGSGKSVFFRLLMGFLEPDHGKILYNGQEHVDIDNYIGYVPQNSIIFNTDYENNISIFGTYKTTKLSFFESFFPQDIIEHIKKSDNIDLLSGGEKQVIMLLRALCSEKPILLLDEPFSAMNQTVINKFMNNMDKIDCMMIIIAHNVSDYIDKFDSKFSV
nr:ABC transporter ATP-binding protein [uncultured Faecalimonas sp.]